MSNEIPLLGVDARAFQFLDGLTVAERENVPIGNIEFGKQGHIEASNGEVALVIDYASPVESVDRVLIKYGLNLADIRVLEQFSLRSLTRGDTVNLLENPSAWTSYFAVRKQNVISFANPYYFATGVTDQDMLTPAGILTHLHEQGHAHTTDFERYMKISRVLRARSGLLSPDEQDVILTSEANAWAFAFNKLSPFLSNNRSHTFYTADLIDFAYGRSMHTYEKDLESLSLTSSQSLGNSETVVFG